MLFDLTLGIQLLLAFRFSSGLGLCGSLGFRGELLALAGACRQHNDQDDQQDQDYGADSDQQQLTLAQTKGAERRRNFLCGILEIGNGNIVRTDIDCFGYELHQCFLHLCIKGGVIDYNCYRSLINDRFALLDLRQDIAYFIINILLVIGGSGIAGAVHSGIGRRSIGVVLLAYNPFCRHFTI